MRLLALDVGMKRTGVAYADTENGIPLPLSTIHSDSEAALVHNVKELALSRGVEKIIVGLPLLLSGSEGFQSTFVRKIATLLEEQGMKILLLDERYTTPRIGQSDPDAAAACALLGIYLDRQA